MDLADICAQEREVGQAYSEWTRMNKLRHPQLPDRKEREIEFWRSGAHHEPMTMQNIFRPAPAQRC
jgi:hypothetical protein